ncbi:MAG TPA: hypothetical protein VGD26_08535 [Chitinophagaceae bacterium]
MGKAGGVKMKSKNAEALELAKETMRNLNMRNQFTTFGKQNKFSDAEVLAQAVIKLSNKVRELEKENYELHNHVGEHGCGAPEVINSLRKKNDQLHKNVQHWMEESFKWNEQSRQERSQLVTLREKFMEKEIDLDACRNDLASLRSAATEARDALTFTLHAAKYLFKPEVELSKGLCPTFYFTHTYDGDLELIEKTKAAEKVLSTLNKVLGEK